MGKPNEGRNQKEINSLFAMYCDHCGESKPTQVVESLDEYDCDYQLNICQRCRFDKTNKCLRDTDDRWWHYPGLIRRLQAWRDLREQVIEDGCRTEPQMHDGVLHVRDMDGNFLNNPFEQIKLHEEKLANLCHNNGHTWRLMSNGVVRKCGVCQKIVSISVVKPTRLRQ